jgi:hypothetical protein
MSATEPTRLLRYSMILGWPITYFESAKVPVHAPLLLSWRITKRLGTKQQRPAPTCSDLIRDSIKHLRDSPEWRLEVTDETGNIRHLFRLTAETFDQ